MNKTAEPVSESITPGPIGFLIDDYYPGPVDKDGLSS